MVDLGPDRFLGRRPEALDLCHTIGLGKSLVPIGGRGAGVWARGRVRPLPEGLALGVPSRFWPSARPGILGLRGVAGLGRDALLPRPGLRGPVGDRSVGPLVAHKLGRRVVDRLVDPLIGGIRRLGRRHVNDSDLPAAAGGGPTTGRSRAGPAGRGSHPGADAPPLFWALDGGMSSFVTRLGAALAARGSPSIWRSRSTPWSGGAPPGP